MLDDNILSLMLGCTTMVPAMRARREGRIVILGSLGGLVPMPHAAVYAATKFAVRGFALSLAFRHHRYRLNTHHYFLFHFLHHSSIHKYGSWLYYKRYKRTDLL